jgi:hypothetical protein
LRLNKARNLVNLAVQSSRGDESTQFPTQSARFYSFLLINEVWADSESLSHIFKSDSLVGFQELRIDNKSHFSDKVFLVGTKILISSDFVDDTHYLLGKIFIFLQKVVMKVL